MSGAYRYIRRAQYLCLSIAAFGLFTMWPRVIIFLLFAGMLFAYYFLARVEERRMLILHPGYAEYMLSTGMFLPGNPAGTSTHCYLGKRQDDANIYRRCEFGPLANSARLSIRRGAVSGVM
jgi:hypothetical protein